MFHGWILLLLSLPPRPSSLRVRAWRRLRGLGAVPLKSGAYLLPHSAEHLEQFQWLAQEIQRDGGDGTLLRVERIENMPEADVVRLFRDARNQDYAELADRYRKLLKGPRPRLADELARLTRDMDRIGDIDFFEAPGRREAERAREAVEQRVVTGRAGPARAVPPLDLGALKARRWVTRPRPHVDRVASAWLIKRFVDPEAEFLFAARDQAPSDAIPFDMAGVDFGHHGDNCTFETLLRRTGLSDRKLGVLAEIVHEADLKDRKFARDVARGIDVVLRGILGVITDDHEALAQGMALFDGLYSTIGERA
jgi:hypothetical protein